MLDVIFSILAWQAWVRFGHGHLLSAALPANSAFCAWRNCSGQLWCCPSVMNVAGCKFDKECCHLALWSCRPWSGVVFRRRRMKVLQCIGGGSFNPGRGGGYDFSLKKSQKGRNKNFISDTTGMKYLFLNQTKTNYSLPNNHTPSIFSKRCLMC